MEWKVRCTLISLFLIVDKVVLNERRFIVKDMFSNVAKKFGTTVSNLTAEKKPSKVEGVELELVIDNGHKALAKLIKNLTDMGNEAFQKAADNGYPVNLGIECIHEKNELANTIAQSKADGISNCENATDGILKKITPPITTSVAELKKFYLATRLETVETCVQKVFESAVHEFGKIYEALINICLKEIMVLKMVIETDSDVVELPKPPKDHKL